MGADAGIDGSAAMTKIVLAALVAAMLSLFADDGSADDAAIGETDRGAIRAVIESQLAAFRRDDGAAAFAFASPTIQQMFLNPDVFMEMVRSGYRPVYRPLEVEFRELVSEGGELVQRVFLVGPDGAPAMALYFMQRQPDGTWRINGCVLAKAPDESV